MPKPIVAVIGTGLMGRPMAANLLNAGFETHCWNRTQEKAEPLKADGAIIHDQLTSAVSNADVVITMVSDGPAVDALLFGSGLASAMKQGACFVDMSSIKPEEAKIHGKKLCEMGLQVLDAPVSGGTKGAFEASLAIMVGGEESSFTKAKPVLEALGRPVLVGPTGSGQLAKLANQAIVGVTIGVVAEAILLVQKGGADPHAFRDALKNGFADSTILQLHGQRMSEETFAPGARATTQLKDLHNIMQEAAQLGLELPLTSQVYDRFARLCDGLGGGDLDHSGLFVELKDRNALD